MAGAVELARGERVHSVLAGKQPPLRPRQLPPGPQQGQKMRRQHHVPVLAPFALLDADDHPGAVDVGDLERDDLGRAQSRAVSDAQRRLVLEAGRRIQEARHLLRAQDDRQPPRLLDEGEFDDDLRLAQRHREKKPQCRQGVIDRRHAGAARHEMQLEAPQILEARLARRSAQEGGKGPDGADVTLLCPRREVAHRHVFDHALAQRAHACVGHGGLLSRGEVGHPDPQTGRSVPRSQLLPSPTARAV